MIPIPQNLKEISKIKKAGRQELELLIFCSCGSDTFNVLKNKIKKTREQKSAEKEYNDFVESCGFRSHNIGPLENGEIYAYRKNFFGKIIDQVNLSEIRSIDNTKIVKIKCCSCGREFTVFDNRLNGYDSIEYDKVKIKQEYKYQQVKINKEIAKLRLLISIGNDESLGKFIDSHGEVVDEDFYSNSYSWIVISGYDIERNNKLVKILNKETR